MDEDAAIKLSRIAALNSVALVAQQVVVVLVSFFITPLLVATVGVAAFGVWQLIVKWSAYLMYLDGRSHENLKWAISRSVALDDDYRRQAVAACLRVWFTFMPLLAVGAALFLLFIGDSGADAQVSESTVVLAASLMVANAWLLGVQRFPEGILNGSNQGYRSAGLRLVVLVASGVASYLVVYSGYGLVGLASVQLVTTALLVLGYTAIVRRHVAWLGVARPAPDFQRKIYRTSFWFFMWSLVNFGLLQMEVLVLGFLGTAEMVSRFVITFYVAQMASVIIETMITAVLPGIGSLLGQGQMDRVSRVRAEGMLYCWWLGVSLTVVVLMVNPSFVSLWVNQDVYAGTLENLLIALMALQMIMVRQDSLLINLALEQKQKVLFAGLSMVLMVALAVVLVPPFGVAGAVISGLCGRTVLLVLYPRIINRFMGLRAEPAIGLRGFAVAAALIGSGWYLSAWVQTQSWFLLVGMAAAIFLAAMLVYYVIGMPARQRALVHARVHAVIARPGKSDR